MCIYKYEIISKNIRKDKPYLNSKNRLVLPKCNKYNYYIIAEQYNDIINDKEYFVILSETKIGNSFIKCKKDLGNINIIPTGAFKDYIYNELSSRNNLEMEFIESENGYDVYHIY